MEGGDMPIEVVATIILGKPSLKTIRTKIDVHVDTFTMEFGDILVNSTS